MMMEERHGSGSKLPRFGVTGALVVGLLAGQSGLASAQAVGIDEEGVGISDVQFGSLAPIVVETGNISWSVDGMGTNNSQGMIQVDKPSAGATVRSAFLASATTGFTGRRLVDGTDVTIAGYGVNWDISTLSSISSWNHWAEVTDLIKPIIDAAPAGVIDLPIGESSSRGIDGESLVVIFDDPEQTTINTVALMFGAQKVNGDTFAIKLSDPIDTTNPNLVLDMSLGISFGYQQASIVNQYSTVDVNGMRMTTSAGGQDDGEPANGALLTVGGIGDANDNPAPNATPTPGPDARRSDDELYSLVPFVQDGDTSIEIFSRNPSNDDNIFFAGLFIYDAAAIVGEGIILGPGNVSLNVGETTDVIATVQDDDGNPIVGRDVSFEIKAGPNAGMTAVVPTDADGTAIFSYAGNGGPGVDEIDASFVDSQGNTKPSNTVLRYWTATMPPACALTDVIAGPPKMLEITVHSPSAGLHKVEVTAANNTDVEVPVFPQGETTPQVVLATKINPDAGSLVALRVTDINGTVTECDPVTPATPEVSEPAGLAPSAPSAGGCSAGTGAGNLPALWMSLLGGLALVARRRWRRD